MDQEDPGLGWGFCMAIDSCLGPRGLRNKRVHEGSCLFTTMGNSASLNEVMVIRARLTAGGPFVKYGVTMMAMADPDLLC